MTPRTRTKRFANRRPPRASRRTPRYGDEDFDALLPRVGAVIDRLPALAPRAGYAKQAIRDALVDHRQYITTHGEDDPRILNWRWGGKAPTRQRSSTGGDNI